MSTIGLIREQSKPTFRGHPLALFLGSLKSRGTALDTGVLSSGYVSGSQSDKEIVVILVKFQIS
jgi:hypothetical protein